MLMYIVILLMMIIVYNIGSNLTSVVIIVATIVNVSNTDTITSTIPIIDSRIYANKQLV